MNWKRWFENRAQLRAIGAESRGPNEEDRYQNFRARLMDEMKVVNFRIVPKDKDESDREGMPT